VDYCYRTLSTLLALSAKGGEREEAATTPKDVFTNFQNTTLVECGPKCISILRYLSEAGDRIPLDAHCRIMDKLNVPQLATEFLDNACPWFTNDSFYQSGKWQKK